MAKTCEKCGIANNNQECLDCAEVKVPCKNLKLVFTPDLLSELRRRESFKDLIHLLGCLREYAIPEYMQDETSEWMIKLGSRELKDGSLKEK